MGNSKPHLSQSKGVDISVLFALIDNKNDKCYTSKSTMRLCSFVSHNLIRRLAMSTQKKSCTGKGRHAGLLMFDKSRHLFICCISNTVHYAALGNIAIPKINFTPL